MVDYAVDADSGKRISQGWLLTHENYQKDYKSAKMTIKRLDQNTQCAYEA